MTKYFHSAEDVNELKLVQSELSREKQDNKLSKNAISEEYCSLSNWVVLFGNLLFVIFSFT